VAGDQVPAVGAAALERALVTGVDLRLSSGDPRVGRLRPFVAFHVEAQEGGERLTGLTQTDRIAGQRYKRPVATDEGPGAVEHGKPLAERVEPGDQDVFRCELAFGWLLVLYNRHSALPGECPAPVRRLHSMSSQASPGAVPLLGIYSISQPSREKLTEPRAAARAALQGQGRQGTGEASGAVLTGQKQSVGSTPG
jgi:hypothetical protein